MEVTYTMQGDYLLPNLLPPQEEPTPLGKYARMRKRFLQEHRKITYCRIHASYSVYLSLCTEVFCHRHDHWRGESITSQLQRLRTLYNKLSPLLRKEEFP